MCLTREYVHINTCMDMCLCLYILAHKGENKHWRGGSKFEKFLHYKHIFFYFSENIHNYKGIFFNLSKVQLTPLKQGGFVYVSM
jgi:hypothetical protein